MHTCAAASTATAYILILFSGHVDFSQTLHRHGQGLAARERANLAASLGLSLQHDAGLAERHSSHRLYMAGEHRLGGGRGGESVAS